MNIAHIIQEQERVVRMLQAEADKTMAARDQAALAFNDADNELDRYLRNLELETTEGYFEDLDEGGNRQQKLLDTYGDRAQGIAARLARKSLAALQHGEAEGIADMAEGDLNHAQAVLGILRTHQ
jgi:hypothetical protein